MGKLVVRKRHILAGGEKTPCNLCARWFPNVDFSGTPADATCIICLGSELAEELACLETNLVLRAALLFRVSTARRELWLRIHRPREYRKLDLSPSPVVRHLGQDWDYAYVADGSRVHPASYRLPSEEEQELGLNDDDSYTVEHNRGLHILTIESSIPTEEYTMPEGWNRKGRPARS